MIFKTGQSLCWVCMGGIDNNETVIVSQYCPLNYNYPYISMLYFIHVLMSSWIHSFSIKMTLRLQQHIIIVRCDIQNRTINRAGSKWVGFDNNETVTVSQYYPLNYCRRESSELTLKNDFRCSQCGGRTREYYCTRFVV